MQRLSIYVTRFWILIIVTLLLIACGLTTPTATVPAPTVPPTAQPPTEAPAVKGRCGDGVCDGPENPRNCPADCSNGRQSIPTTMPAEKEQKSTDTPVMPTQAVSSPIIAEIFLEGTVVRDDGEGTCGTAPWGVDNIAGGDFSCPPPKYWFGYHFEITAHQQVNLVPQGEGWVFQPRTSGGGAYQQADAWSDGNRVCEPVSIQAAPFDFAVSGAAADGEIVIEISTNSFETASWVCTNGYSYERETTLVQIDMGMALSGVYDDLSVLLTEADRISEARYQKTFELDTNPSPHPRDHVKALLTFSCMSVKDEKTLVESACPW